MNNQLERFRKMHRLIKFKRTGPPEQFAEQLSISQSLLYRLLGELKAMGGPVHFCHLQQTYAYYENVELQLGFVPVAATGTQPESLGLHQGATIRPLLVEGSTTRSAQRS